MNVGITAIIIVSSFFLLFGLGIPIAFSLLSVSVIGLLVFIGPKAVYNVVPVTLDVFSKDIYIALPLFVYMASLLDVSGIGERLYSTMYKLFAGLKGGLAMATIAFCTIIAAMSSMAATGTVIMGLLAYPEMIKRNYSKMLAIGCIPAGGALGPLIPPSITAILVGGLSGISVGGLFTAAIIPGLICSLGFMMLIVLICIINPKAGPAIPKEERPNWKEKISSLQGIIAPVILVIMVLGSIYSGIATPTEAGSLGAVGAMVCTILGKKFDSKNIFTAVTKSLSVTCMLMWMMLGGVMFASLLSLTGVQSFVRQYILGLNLGPMATVAVMLLILLILGMVMESLAIVMICLPLMMNVVAKLGIDPLWFGFLFVFSIIIGLITPPYGLNIFYFMGLGHKGVTMSDAYKSIVPYCIIMIMVLVLCFFIPSIVTWLPSTMHGK